MVYSKGRNGRTAQINSLVNKVSNGNVQKVLGGNPNSPNLPVAAKQPRDLRTKRTMMLWTAPRPKINPVYSGGVGRSIRQLRF